MKNSQQLIIKSLAISTEDYLYMVESCGYTWLSRLKDERIIARVSRLKLFWSWWNNQWEIRDKEYIRSTNLEEINEELRGHTLWFARDLYNDTHDPNELTIVPNVWLREAINKIVSAEIQKAEVYVNALSK